MRKIIINEEQKRIIMDAEMSRANGASLPVFMNDRLDSAGNPLKDTGYFLDGTLTKLAAARNAEIVGNFSDDINSYGKDEIFSKLSKLIEKCKRLEEPVRAELSKICCETAKSIFGITGDDDCLIMDCEIVEGISPSQVFHIKPNTDEEREYEDIDEIEGEEAEIRKRKLINAISYGAASRIAERARNEWLPKIFELNEELPHLYSQIMKINEYLIFNTDVKIEDEKHSQGGYVEVKLAKEGYSPKIVSRAIIFPILFQETVKGIIELLSSYGLPDDEATARQVSDKSDVLENEPWEMRIGPALWDCVDGCLGNNMKTEEFPFFYKSLVSLPSGEFEHLMKNVFAGTRSGRREIENLYKKSKYDREYDDFLQDIGSKRQAQVLEGDCFSDEEISRWE